MNVNKIIPNYRGIHFKVERRFGKEKRCQMCGDTSPRMYQWANISGLYTLKSYDWLRVCVPCHRRFDNWKGRKCKEGHALMQGNIYLHKDGYRQCMICKKAINRKHMNNNNKSRRVGRWVLRYI